MKKLTSVLFACSILLAGTAIAEQSGDSSDPRHKKGKGHDAEEKSDSGKHAAPKQSEAKQSAPKMEKREARKSSEAPGQPIARKHEARQAQEAPSERKHEGRNDVPAQSVQAAKVKNNASRKQAAARVQSARSSDAPKKHAKTERDNVIHQPANSVRTTESADHGKKFRDRRSSDSTDRAARPRAANAKRPAPEKIREIQKRYTNFRAKPQPDRVKTVIFRQDRRIEHSDRWKGPKYEVFRSYRPERHNREYYHSHYDRVELISGGYYYQRNNYWYPAWGYQPDTEYYAYDGPIYVGQRVDPPDRVIADVQATLQDMGYYKGEVDGLLGPLTREALAGYQSDQGLQTTEAIDEPTLDELGLS